MNKKFAVFDVDGTLIDSMGIWSSLGREYLFGKGITENIDGVSEEVETLTISEAAELFVKRFSLPDTAKKVAHDMNCMMDEHYKKDIPLKQGIKEHLEKLCQAGVRMCVATAADPDLVEICLKRLEIRSCFEFILSCESMNTSKREPEIYLEAARRFHALPEEVAVYEDALYAVETAKKAGFYVVGVYEKETGRQWKQICELADERIGSAALTEKSGMAAQGKE